jgi:membrane associated rhomboid family serine protease
MSALPASPDALLSPPAPKPGGLRENVYLLFGFVGLFWVVEIVDRSFAGLHLDALGIFPRDLVGLRGIVFAPFLHGNFTHLMGNSIPFIVLGGMVLMSGRKVFLEVFALSALVAGIGTWIFAAPTSVHIGVSGVIFGFLGFLLFRAWFGRRILWVLVALAAGFLYGGLVFTLLRYQQGISWQGHFFGFLGGAFAAWLATREDAPPLRW